MPEALGRPVPRIPVRVGAGRLAPQLAESYPWGCNEHLAAGARPCKTCCGACHFLVPGEGCALGSFKPMRCRLYPLIPQEDRVIIDQRCPEAAKFVTALERGDARARALLDVAKSLSDLVAKGGWDQSEELAWLMTYAADGFAGPALWSRGRILDAPLPPIRDAPKRAVTRRGRD